MNVMVHQMKKLSVRQGGDWLMDGLPGMCHRLNSNSCEIVKKQEQGAFSVKDLRIGIP